MDVGTIAVILAAVVTVGGALLYVLGLLALGWPIYRGLANRDVFLFWASLLAFERLASE